MAPVLGAARARALIARLLTIDGLERRARAAADAAARLAGRAQRVAAVADPDAVACGSRYLFSHAITSCM